ncbi:hypothetical protein [uncultured Streptococcus sp.]|uniref:hypothetical protein n=1 Tax=uncultured Streptococcus sp. TaxID=83427 RepID=UPI00208F2B00|nr:hypothetical protein [uncultured Streptococcus sp.]MCO4640669.1 hypothetical protein [Streptococcus infantarius subsp. infantarius]MCO4645192.1 hypothetical protein [Streptococcus infantarius subsp. infantarius]
MKKKLLAVLLAFMSVALLVACSSKDDLDGEYYWVRGANSLQTVVVIDGNSGTIEVDGVTYSITDIDTDKKQLTVSADSDYVLPYSYDDGELTITEDSLYGFSAKVTYYKKGSEALEEAIEDAKDDD